MKKLMTIFGVILFASSTNFCNSQNLPSINMADKSFSLYMNKYDDTPLIYGFTSPNLKSEKLICFSSFTSDVEKNPHKCVLGAYYETDDLSIEYITIEGNFVKLKFKTDGKQDRLFYIEKKSIKFE
tara:strand:+ start:202 stop:579 length:378 start_codon:yes stop_codon:yes gene_type:complete